MTLLKELYCWYHGGHFYEILDNMGAKHCLKCHKLVGVEFDEFEA